MERNDTVQPCTESTVLKNILLLGSEKLSLSLGGSTVTALQSGLLSAVLAGNGCVVCPFQRRESRSTWRAVGVTEPVFECPQTVPSACSISVTGMGGEGGGGTGEGDCQAAH